MSRIDLNDYLDRNPLASRVPRVRLSEIRLDGGSPVPFAQAVVNVDTGAPISIVGGDYELVPHGEILDTVESAMKHIALRDSDVPRGIFLTNRGAKMRAIFKFPRFRRAVAGDDELCPVIRIQNSYDKSTRITIEIGAFRYACTNFGIGGGIFAGGFSAIHQGDISVIAIQEQLENFLDRFDELVETFRRWMEFPWRPEDAAITSAAIAPFGPRNLSRIPALVDPTSVENRFRAYNNFTYHATHGMRTANAAFRFLDTANQAFYRLGAV